MNEQALREHLVWLLNEGNAHLSFDQAISGLPEELRGAAPPGVVHTPWRLLEHLRLCQWDILEYCRNPEHVSPEFPDGYWPKEDYPPTDEDWDKSLTAFREDLCALVDLINDPKTDLFAEVPGGDGHTILREALLLADHNAYHLGQLIIIRRALGAWPEI